MRNILIFLAGSLIIMAGCHSPAENKETAKEETADSSGNTVQLTDIQVKNAGVITGKPELRQMHTSLKVNGVIDVPPQNLVSISIPLGGYLKTMTLLPGLQVKKAKQYRDWPIPPVPSGTILRLRYSSFSSKQGRHCLSHSFPPANLFLFP